jgi:hypothetical protein
LTTLPSDAMRRFLGIEQKHALKAHWEIPLHRPFGARVIRSRLFTKHR